MSGSGSGSELVLPELTTGVLDGETLSRLLADLGSCTEVLEVQVKGGAEVRARAGALGLQEAGALLLSGGVRGVQVRYLYEGAVWCDTLIGGGAGIRLVRMKAEGGA